MQTTISVSVKGQELIITKKPVVATGGVGENFVHFSFAEDWDGYEKTAVFYREEGNAYHCLVKNNACTIPSEVLEEEGQLFFGVFGTKDELKKPSQVVSYRIHKGAIIEGVYPSEPTPDIYAQILSVANNAVNVAESVRADADAGRFTGAKGEPGADGGYYTPSVSDGVLSWSASKEDMSPIPSSVVKGDKGDKGDTGSKGEQGIQGEKGDKGDTGTSGTDGLSIYTDPNKYGSTTMVSLTTINVPEGRTVQAGDLIVDGTGKVFLVTSVSGDFVYIEGTGINLKGADGAQGPQGETGEQGPQGETGPAYTLNNLDMINIANIVKRNLATETWTFELEDGTTVTKAVYVG